MTQHETADLQGDSLPYKHTFPAKMSRYYSSFEECLESNTVMLKGQTSCVIQLILYLEFRVYALFISIIWHVAILLNARSD